MLVRYLPTVGFGQNAQIIMTLPPEVTFNEVVAKNSVIGPGELTVDKAKNRILITKASNGGSPSAPSSNISIQFIYFMGLINPKSTKKTQKIQLQIFNEKNKLI